MSASDYRDDPEYAAYVEARWRRHQDARVRLTAATNRPNVVATIAANPPAPTTVEEQDEFDRANAALDARILDRYYERRRAYTN